MTRSTSQEESHASSEHREEVEDVLEQRDAAGAHDDYHEIGDEVEAHDGAAAEAGEDYHHHNYEAEGHPEESRSTPQRSSSVNSNDHPMKRYAEMQAQLRARRAAQQDRIDQFLQEFNGAELPTEEELQNERREICEQVRHHKDEVDSLCLQIEDQQVANAPVYQLAARVARLEEFVTKADAYVKNDLKQEVDRVIDSDGRHSEDEVAAYIKQLQQQRDEALQKMKRMEERNAKRTLQFRQGQLREPPSKVRSFNDVQSAHDGMDRCNSPVSNDLSIDDETEKLLEYNAEANEDKAELTRRLKQLKHLRSKLQATINRIKHSTEKQEQEMHARIRHSELANTRDQRMCQQINSNNAGLTTSAQIIMSQLNVEYYGMDGTPAAQMMIKQQQQAAEKEKAKRQERRAIEANKNPAKKAKPAWADIGSGITSNASSRRPSTAAKAPLVALKPTASQKTRNAALKAERAQREEERSEARHRTASLGRNSDEAPSAMSSRRASLAGKPPLVALKPTASQKTRNAELKSERERRASMGEASHRRSLGGASENSHAGKPPLVASKSTEAQKMRNAELRSERASRHGSISGASDAGASQRAPMSSKHSFDGVRDSQEANQSSYADVQASQEVEMTNGHEDEAEANREL